MSRKCTIRHLGRSGKGGALQIEHATPLSMRSMRAIWDTWMLVLMFFVIWIVRSLTFPAIDCLLDCERDQALLILGWKTIVWFLLPMIYLWRVDHEDPLEFLRLNSKWKANLYCMTGLMGIGIIWQAGLIISQLDNSFPTIYEVMISIWGAGVCEEVLFRGFFLRKFSQFMSPTRSILTTSVLFVLAHVPGWLVYGGNAASHILMSGLYIFVISIILSLMVNKTKSLYPSIGFHIIADLIAF
jgi:membrane protease YdiL (CAAX protease family)